MGRAPIVLLSVLVVAGGIWVALPPAEDAAPVAPSVVRPDAAPRETMDPAPLAEEPVDAVPAPLSPAASSSAEPRVEEPPTAAGPLVVRVDHAVGRPATGARVALYDGPTLLGHGVLDVDGRWSHPGDDAAAELFVLGVTPAAARFELSPARGTHALTLPVGAHLEGVVRVDGAPPGTPFPLVLSGLDRVSERVLLEGRDELPPPAARPGELTSSVYDGFLTDGTGRFLVSGLEPGAELSLRWPRTYVLESPDDPPFPRVVPAEGVVIPLRSPRMLVGRVVHADGRPAVDAEVSATLRYERTGAAVSGMSRGYGGRPVDADGRFRIALHDPFGGVRHLDDDEGEVSGVVLGVDVVADAGPDGVARAGVEDLSVDRDHDLGDLVLERAASVTLLVRAPDGAPVAGALVRAESTLDARTEETDAEGRVVVDLGRADLATATIVAPGFHTARVALPEHGADVPLVVRLERTTSVRVVAHGPWDDDPDEDGWRFEMEVTSSGSPYRIATLPAVPGREVDRLPDALRAELGRPEHGTGRSSSSTSGGDGPCTAGWEMRRPDLLFEDLRADHALRFRIEVVRAPEAYGTLPDDAVWDSGDLWLHAGEQRELVVDLSHLAGGD